MQDWLGIAKQLGFQITPWVIVLVLILYIFREQLIKFLNALLDWIGTIFHGEWSYRRFEHIFRPAIRAMHLYMRVVGISVEKGREPAIPEAYVPLRLAPYLGDDTENANRISGNRMVGGRSTNQVPLPGVQHESEARSIEEVLQSHSTVVVLGDPGAGKSTLLKHLIIRFTEPRKREQVSTIPPRRLLTLKRSQRSRAIVPCPLYVPLRSCRQENKTLLDDILDPETKILAGMLPSNQRKKMPAGFIERCIKDQHAILLLDGLDEVASEEMYVDVVNKINDLYLSYPKTRVVVTCRIAGWRRKQSSDDETLHHDVTLYPNFVLYRALPLDRQQQHDFIDRWYQTAYQRNEGDESSALLEEEKNSRLEMLHQDRKLEAGEEADALKGLLRERERLAELAANPMLLSLICLVYQQRRDLPRGRAELYDDCVKILLGVWDKIDKGLRITKPTLDEKRKILRHVAYKMHTEGQKDISRQDFVELVMGDLGVKEQEAHYIVRQIQVRSWLIVERVIDRFAFSHLTLQEFFVVEYLRTEQHGILDLDSIKDWNIWLEPISLMCGKATDPTTFIEHVAAHNAALALLCITEADRTLLNIQRIRPLLNQTLEQMRDGKLALVELTPTLVALLGIEQSPFTTKVMDFMRAMLIQRIGKEARSQLVTTIASSSTREAARLLLHLYQAMPGEGPIVLDGLLLIGDLAVEEVLQWHRRGALNKADLRVFLLRCYALEATRVLWERYGLPTAEATEEERINWAESWARRLTLPENENLVRSIPYSGPVDTEIWPYRKSQHTALAAIVQQCVQILHKVYVIQKDDEEKFVSTVEHIAQFDLRIQIPLLIRLDFPTNFHSNYYYHHIAVALEFRRDSDRNFLQETSWYALIAAGGKRSEENFWHRVSKFVSSIGMSGGCILLWAGAIILLWHVIPIWLLIIGIVPLVFGCVLSVMVLFAMNTKWQFPEFHGISGVILGWLVLMLLIGYLWTWADRGEKVRRFLATKEMHFWYLIMSLAMTIGCGVLGGFAIQAWFHLALLLSMFIVGLSCLLCNGLWEWMWALSGKSLLPWLEQHPRGQVVLDEFRE